MGDFKCGAYVGPEESKSEESSPLKDLLMEQNARISHLCQSLDEQRETISDMQCVVNEMGKDVAVLNNDIHMLWDEIDEMDIMYDSKIFRLQIGMVGLFICLAGAFYLLLR